jgi:hypothetical protein
MKKIFLLMLMLIAQLSMAQNQNTNSNTAEPLLSFPTLPFDLAFKVKTAIRAEYDPKMKDATGADKILLDSIESQINANKPNEANRTYTVLNVPTKYAYPIIQFYMNTRFIEAQKIIADYNMFFPILQQIQTQKPLYLKQVCEAPGSMVKYSDMQPYLPR